MAQGTSKTKQRVPMEKFLNKARNTFLGTNPPLIYNSVERDRRDQTRAFYYDSGQQNPLALSDIASVVKRNGQENATVIVIENIDSNWRVELSRIFDIDATFFDEHALNPEGPSPWQAVFGPKQIKPTQRISHTSRQSTKFTTTISWHVDGVFSWESSENSQVNPKTSRMEDPNFNQRRLEYDHQYGWQSNTRLSHYIFLVDAPMKTASPFFSPIGSRDTLRLPLSNSRGGVELPALLMHSKHSIFDCLKQFFSHAWHVRLIKHQVISDETILYLLIASTWSYNLREIEQSIRHIAFNELRRPRIEINDRLLDERQNIVLLRQEVAAARKWIPTRITDELNTVEAEKCVAFPDLALKEVFEGAETTDQFLMDTFQLLISSISVLDSEISVRQSYSAQKLTQLAFIFVPLNLVTSIFGMNLAEINGSPLPAWICAVVLVAVVACTVGVFAAYNKWEKRLRR
ncbi:hypothetical protein J7T55_004634 [Diaporthe amygdali]|uniref:uncharacterized protein n=1 Tax=Phomopsis amygdali TaxID=1214568 RepID=UPI0022FE3F61|nr:uncharacterized protein J7T55_004634 [Diaporthe amygdali]KAJ0114892.1 hypothetical protein J7T55_004634 [Diaporthe amygdali]